MLHAPRATLFPDDPRFHVPPNLYHALDQHGALAPAFINSSHSAACSDYRLVDWLAVFGVVLDDIPRLQATLPVPLHDADRRTRIWRTSLGLLSFDQSRRAFRRSAAAVARMDPFWVPGGMPGNRWIHSSCTQKSDAGMRWRFLISSPVAWFAFRRNPTPPSRQCACSAAGERFFLIQHATRPRVLETSPCREESGGFMPQRISRLHKSNSSWAKKHASWAPWIWNCGQSDVRHRRKFLVLSRVLDSRAARKSLQRNCRWTICSGGRGGAPT